MRNIVIFSDKDSAQIEAILSKNEEYDVRVKGLDDVKDAQKFNPSGLIFNCSIDKLKDISMVTKLPAPALIIAEKFND